MEIVHSTGGENFLPVKLRLISAGNRVIYPPHVEKIFVLVGGLRQR